MIFTLMAAAIATTSNTPTSVAAGVEVGVASSMEQLRPDASSAGLADQASLTALRNEIESFQVLIDGPATNVNVTGDLFGWGTTTLFRLAEYVVTEPSDGEGGTGAWRDALIPERDIVFQEDRNAFPVDVADGASLAVWVDVHIPTSTAADVSL